MTTADELRARKMAKRYAASKSTIVRNTIIKELEAMGPAAVGYAAIFLEEVREKTTRLDELRRRPPSQKIYQRNDMSDHSIRNSGTMTGVAIAGRDQVLIDSMKNIEATIGAVKKPELQKAMEALRAEVESLLKVLPPEKKEEAAQDLQTLVTETAKAAPRKKFWELSRDGLVEAAGTVADMAPKIAIATRAVWELIKATAR